ncbi:MAG: hypothetical protein ABIG71_03640, partial [Candidatus Uhrbacteria bacterium]
GLAILVRSHRWWQWGIGGLCIGLALTMRTHELIWVATLLIVVFAITRSKKKLPLACALVIGMALPFIPVLAMQQELYGSLWTTGYSVLGAENGLPTEFSGVPFLPGFLQAFIAPFGWHPVLAVQRFWQYLILPYWWFIGLASLGLITGVADRRASSMKWGAIGTIVLTAWLVLFYGSWTLADPLVRAVNVLTISYVRYWLPIVVLLAPWAAYGLLALVRRMPSQWARVTIGLIMVGIAFASTAQVVLDPIEGLRQQSQALEEHRARARAVVASTEPNAIIVSHRMDKVFFPERAVIHASEQPELDTQFLDRLARVDAPRYWYGPNAPQLPGFTLIPVGDMPFHEQLFRLR